MKVVAMIFAVELGDVGLVVLGAAVATVVPLINAVVTNHYTRTMEADRRKHERMSEDERREREADAELVNICSAFLTRAESVVRKALQLAEQQSPWDDPSAEFDSVYAPGNKLRLIASPSVASATKAVMHEVANVQYHLSAGRRNKLVQQGDRNIAWEQFDQAVKKFRDAAAEQFDQAVQKFRDVADLTSAGTSGEARD